MSELDPLGEVDGVEECVDAFGVFVDEEFLFAVLEVFAVVDELGGFAATPCAVVDVVAEGFGAEEFCDGGVGLVADGEEGEEAVFRHDEAVGECEVFFVAGVDVWDGFRRLL